MMHVDFSSHRQYSLLKIQVLGIQNAQNASVTPDFTVAPHIATAQADTCYELLRNLDDN